jgi:hypothetical protein
MSIHLKSYPHETTLAAPGYVRPPTTLFERFRADPRGAESFPEWLNDRVWELLQRAAKWDCLDTENGGGVSFDGDAHGLLWDAIRAVRAPKRTGLINRVRLLNGTMIKEWLQETKDSATVESA